MKPFIVVTDGMHEECFKTLLKAKEFVVHPEKKVSDKDFKRLLPKVSGMVLRSRTKITEDILEKSPQLKVVIRAGEGTDNIDKKACARFGVRVANTPGANNNAVAEHAIMVMLGLLRHLPASHQSMMEKRWDKHLYTGREISCKKIGILGLGKIGRLVADKLAGFRPKIFFFDPNVVESDSPSLKSVSSMEELFCTCDIITVHIPLTERTKGMIGRELIGRMLPHALLVNTSRGGIIDEKILGEFLSLKKIGGAALDVFENEPLESDSILNQLPNVILTPHIGGATVEAQEQTGRMAIDQLREFFSSGHLSNEVKN